MIRTAKNLVHRLDHTLGRSLGRRHVLVELRTPVYSAVLGPIYERLRADHDDVTVWFTSESPEVMRKLVPAGSFLTHAEAEWRRFDLYINADPWAAARLRRCASRINFFHGVAGKYDLDSPAGLPMGFEYYDRVAFINRDRMVRYMTAGIVTSAQARLVGYPKLDALARGEVEARIVRASLRLETTRPTILYAPTYSTRSSLHLAGEDIVRALARAGLNVIVKLHDRSLDLDPRYTGGIDWRTRMRALERAGQVVFGEGPDASPYLAAADLVVTDHSSVGFEFLVLDRPLVVFDAPDLTVAARINPEKIALLRSAAAVAADVPALVPTVERELAMPQRLSRQRSQVAATMFHDPGGATTRALDLVHELLVRAVPAGGRSITVRAQAGGDLR